MMASFEYVGPVLAVQAEGGLPDVLVPGMTCNVDAADPYVGRLVDRGHLVAVAAHYQMDSMVAVEAASDGFIFPWFRVNSELVLRSGSVEPGEYYQNLVSLFPASVYGHFPDMAESQFAAPTALGIIEALNSVLMQAGIEASLLGDQRVRLSSQQVFYCGATDADGPPIGLVFADFVAPLVG